MSKSPNTAPGVKLHRLPPALANLPRTQAIPDGYPKLANLMGNYAEMAIFRRFGDLNYLNALSIQAELLELQVQLKDICHEDNHCSDPDRLMYSKYFHALRNSEGGRGGDQLEKIMQIRAKLDQYSISCL
jgi:hypothetical protein